MKIDGVSEWLKKLERLNREVPEKLEQALTDEANDIIYDVKKETPVGKYTNPVRFTTRDGKEVSFKVKSIPPGGELQSKWEKEKTGKFKWEIFNNTEYANHVEYGHRIIQGKSKKLKGYVKGRYMLHKSMRKGKRRLVKNLNTLMKNLFK